VKDRVGWFALLLVIAVLAACSGSPVVPTTNIPSGTLPPAQVAPLPSGTRVFASPAPVSPSERLSGWTIASSYVLYPDGTFDVPMGASDYRGTYIQRTDGTIDFNFYGWNTAGPWKAAGTLSGEQLIVRYNVVMGLSDFEDAVYTLRASSPSSARD